MLDFRTRRPALQRKILVPVSDVLNFSGTFVEVLYTYENLTKKIKKITKNQLAPVIKFPS